jgi:GT2 family glycosyltransferase
MSKEITLVVPTLRRYDLLAQMLIASAERGTRPPDRYFVIDNGGQLDPAAYGLPTVKTTVYKPGRNIGVAASWNHAMRTIPEYTIMACDDMALFPNTIEMMVAAADEDPSAGFIYPAENAHTMFGVYLMRSWCFQQIGDFDEAFSPAYFEDNDYAHRLALAGMKTKVAPNCGLTHVVSGTLKTFNEGERAAHNANFERLRSHYVQKWGGLPSHERFKTPFNK